MARTAPLVLSTSCHDQPCFTAHDLSEEQLDTIRRIVLNVHMLSDDYKMSGGTRPFLQGSAFRGASSWVLVEFWSRDTTAQQAYIDHINRKLGLV